MGLNNRSFDDISEADLSVLISSGVSEGLLLEYKRETYGSTDADKKEFLKDISSMANTAGGHLIIGIEESDGSAAALSPITGVDADAELLRLESLARDGIEPRLPAARFRSIQVSSGGFAIVVRIPRSWNAPHRVVLKGSNRFYARNSAGAFEMSVSELRAKFNASADALDAAVAFHQRRVALIGSGEGILPLANADGRLTIHLIPLQPLGDVDLEEALKSSDLLRPMGAQDWSSEFNFDGFANIRGGEQAFGYTQVFRNGVVEATKVRLVATRQGVRSIPALSFGEPIVAAIPKYLTALKQLEVPAPIAIIATMEGVRGAYLGYSNSAWQEKSFEIRRDVLDFPPILISEYASEETYVAALRPIFDAVWNAGGMSRTSYFDEKGRWAPPR